MSLSLTELAYQTIQYAYDSFAALVTTNGTASSPITTPSNDLLNQVLPKDEPIQEIPPLEERPWETSHRHT